MGASTIDFTDFSDRFKIVIAHASHAATDDRKVAYATWRAIVQEIAGINANYGVSLPQLRDMWYDLDPESQERLFFSASLIFAKYQRR